MKRSIVVLMALIGMASFAFPAGKTVLKVWHGWPQGSPQYESWGVDFEQACSDWQTKNPNFTLKIESMTNEVYKQKLQTTIAGGATPDVFFTWAGEYTQPFIDAGKLLALDSYLTPAFKARMLKNTQAQTVGGKLYAVPLAGWDVFLYCNRDMFKQNGLQYPKTFDDLVNVVKAFKAKGIDMPMAMGNQERWPAVFPLEMLAIRYVGPTNITAALKANRFDLKDPGYLKAAQGFKQLVDAGAYSADVLAISINDAVAGFKAGKSPMMLQGVWFAGAPEDSDSLVKGKVDCVPFPMVTDPTAKGKATDHWGGTVDSYAVGAQVKNPKEVVDLLCYVMLQMAEKGFVRGYNVPPVYKVDVAPTAIKSDLAKQMVSFVNSAQSFTPSWDQTLNAVNTQNYLDNLAKLLGGEFTPEQFVQSLPH